MRRTVLVLACLAACKPHPHAAPVPRDAAAPAARAIDWTACAQALAARSDGWELAALHACAPCDVTTILAWGRPAADGGPSRQAIAAAMNGCHAFCTGSARERFMATLDDARGVDQAPWRYLGQMCKDQVGASTEAARFMSAPLFALDRMARAVGAHGDRPAAALAAIDLPLPPLTISGTGPTLPPDPGDGIALPPGRLALTVIGTQLYLGRLPHAKLDTYGIHVVASGTPYPGDAITDSAVASKVPPGMPLPVLALAAAPAAPLADIVAHAPGVSLELAVARPPVLGDWMRVTVLPVALVGATPTRPAGVINLDGPPLAPPPAVTGPIIVALGQHATVAQLAELLHLIKDRHQVTLKRQ